MHKVMQSEGVVKICLQRCTRWLPRNLTYTEMYMCTVYKGSIFCTPTPQKGFLSRDNYCPVLANFRAFCSYKQMWCSVPTFTSSRQKQPQSNGLIITRFPLSFHCQFDTLFRHHTGHLLLKWVRSSVCNHPLKIKKAIEENILQFRWGCGGRKRGSAPCFWSSSGWRPNSCVPASSVSH